MDSESEQGFTCCGFLNLKDTLASKSGNKNGAKLSMHSSAAADARAEYQEPYFPSSRPSNIKVGESPTKSRVQEQDLC